MSLSFFETTHRMLPGVHLPTRATLIQTGRGCVLISPIPFTAQQLDSIQNQGEVIAVVEPNAFHNKWARESKNKFPRAELWGVPGIEQRCKNVRFDKHLTQDPWPFEDELHHQILAGADKINEVVFFHPSTKTLIVTDLAFNIKKPRGLLTPILFRLMGFYKRFAVSGLWKRAATNRDSFNASLRKILAWEFDRLVLAHGPLIESGAKAKLELALREAGWLT